MPTSSSTTEVRDGREKRKISLVLADVDGTLVTAENVLTKRAQNAVKASYRTLLRACWASETDPTMSTIPFNCPSKWRR